jgi:2-polyprenyl-3-methyl-5-hydroxy-6-metoxy-1,4-benzoquinol methylase
MHKLNKTYQYYENVNLALANQLPESVEILDVGCGYGAIWEKFKHTKNHVLGLDSSEAPLKVAKDRMNEVCLANITDAGEVEKVLKDRKFDLIVLADILEHVYDPFSTLSIYKPYLKPGGKFLISIPNIGVWYFRLSILFGQFNYSDSGILDRTHIRFFTLESFRKLLHAANLKIIKEDFNPGIFTAFVPIIRAMNEKKSKDQPVDPKSIYESKLNKIYLKYVFPIERVICSIRKSLFAFQLIFVAENLEK